MSVFRTRAQFPECLAALSEDRWNIWGFFFLAYDCPVLKSHWELRTAQDALAAATAWTAQAGATLQPATTTFLGASFIYTQEIWHGGSRTHSHTAGGILIKSALISSWDLARSMWIKERTENLWMKESRWTVSQSLWEPANEQLQLPL